MGKVLLIGSNTIHVIPSYIEGYIKGLADQGHEFIMRDRSGIDSEFHYLMSRVGATDRATIYSMGVSYNNRFKLAVNKFNTTINEADKKAEITAESTGEVCKVIDGVEALEELKGNEQYREFLSKRMIDDCDIAMCVWDGESKAELRLIQLLNIMNKPCYTYRIK